MRTILLLLMLSASTAMAQKSTKVVNYNSAYLFSKQKVVYIYNQFPHLYCYLENSSAGMKGGVALRGSEIDSFYSSLKRCLVSFKAWNSGGNQPTTVMMANAELFWFDSNEDVQTFKTDLTISFKTYDGAKLMIVRIDDFVTALNYTEAIAFTKLFSPATVNE
jgi:hypothetical protein